MAGFAEHYTVAFVNRGLSIDPTDAAAALPHPAASVTITAGAGPNGGERVHGGAGAGDDLQVTLRLGGHDQVHIVPGRLSWPRSEHLLGGKGLHLYAVDTGRLLSAV